MAVCQRLPYFKKGEKSFLANWWPITVLGADLKILSKTITRHLTGVIGSVDMADQTCGVPGLSCGLNLVLVRDVLSWAEQRRLPLALLSLDQEKAFDRVAHGFLFKVLERMGFGPIRGRLPRQEVCGRGVLSHRSCMS